MIVAEAELKAIVEAEFEIMANYEADLQLFDSSRRLIFSRVPSADGRVAVDPAEAEGRLWETLAAELDEAGEYVDPGERLYATRLVFPNQSDSITIVISSRR